MSNGEEIGVDQKGGIGGVPVEALDREGLLGKLRAIKSDGPYRLAILQELLKRADALTVHGSICLEVAQVIGVPEDKWIPEGDLPADLFLRTGELNRNYLNPDGTVNIEAVRAAGS